MSVQEKEGEQQQEERVLEQALPVNATQETTTPNTLLDTLSAPTPPEAVPPPMPVRRSNRVAGRATSVHEANLMQAWQGEDARGAYLASETRLEEDTSSGESEPQTAQEAVMGKDWDSWKAAMLRELDNIESKGTWVEVMLPPGRNAIASRWVFAQKYNANGKVIEYKARIVAKGFSQQPGVDYELTYAPIGRIASIRLLLTLAATLGLKLGQADVEGAYLNADLDEEIYMEHPDAVVKKRQGTVLRLLKSLYGLKQSARVWWLELGKALHELGFKRLEGDWGMYHRPGGKHGGPMPILAYVDNMVRAGRSDKEIDVVMVALKKQWVMTEIGETSQIVTTPHCLCPRPVTQ